MYTLTVTGLDALEADHVNEILLDYKRKMLEKKLEGIVEDQKDNGARSKWIDDHLVWHESIMRKMKWKKE